MPDEPLTCARCGRPLPSRDQEWVRSVLGTGEVAICWLCATPDDTPLFRWDQMPPPRQCCKCGVDLGDQVAAELRLYYLKHARDPCFVGAALLCDDCRALGATVVPPAGCTAEVDEL